MRKLTKTVSALLTAVMLMGIVLCAPFTVSALTSGDYEYTILDDGTAEITGYNNDEKELEIPSQLDGYTVTSIGSFAFNYSGLTSVTIPYGITNISDSAFSGSWYLSNVVLSDSVTKIGTFAFASCESLTSITLSNNLQSIGFCAFDGCKNLTTIVIPDSVMDIGDGVFRGCTNLANISISNNIKNIGFLAFDDTAWYKNQSDGLVYIGKVAYKYKGEMPKDTSIKLNDGTAGISAGAFSNCTNLKSITIPDSVTAIGDWAFENCTSLKNITIPHGVTEIGDSAFSHCTSLESITLPNSLKSISNSAFSYCINLTGITLPVGIKNIGNNAFFFCSNLKDIIIPEGVENIGIRAFQGCDGIKNLSFPQSLTNIDWCAFNSCDGLEEVILPKSIKTLGSGAFAECANLKKAIIPGTLEVIEEGVFYKCENLEEVIISEGVKTIKEPQSAEGYADPSLANGAFCGCTNLKVITIPKSITFIGEVAFDKYNETKVTICGYKGSAAENYAIENGFDFVTINDYTDVDSQIIVTAGTDAELKVEEITNTDEIEKVNFMLEKEKVEILYDISFVKDGTTVQPDGTVTVKIPCTNENSKVYRVETDGTLTDLNAVYDNGYMVFTTKHFSLYALVVPNDNVIGDVNSDGEINAKDRMMLTRYLAKWSGYENIDMTAADVNNDDAVNAKDRMILTRHLAKWQGYETLPLN